MKSLDQLMLQHGSDKSSAHHDYCKIYERYFSPIRNKKLLLLELGIGGYEHPDRGGGDLKAFAEYFPNGTIVGVDIHDKSGIKFPARVKTFQGSEDDGTFLNGLIEKIGNPDIIINDGSHVNALAIASFDILFPHLKSGGIYIYEDLHTSYWSENYGGTVDCLDLTKKSGMNYLKLLADNINACHIQPTPTHPYSILKNATYLYNHVASVHFYKETAIILKK